MDKDEIKKEEDNGPKTIDAGKEAAIEAEVQAARQRAVVPLEIRMKQFRDMLSEKDVCILIDLCLVYKMKIVITDIFVELKKIYIERSEEISSAKNSSINTQDKV